MKTKTTILNPEEFSQDFTDFTIDALVVYGTFTRNQT